jgi:uncharacterized protein YjdB
MPQELKVTILPETATNKAYTLTSSDPEVLEIVGGNKFKAVGKEGDTATLTVTTEDGGFTAECEVTVKASDVKVDSVSLDLDSIDAEEGETISVTL